MLATVVINKTYQNGVPMNVSLFAFGSLFLAETPKSAERQRRNEELGSKTL
jgi:hypothetical protein